MKPIIVNGLKIEVSDSISKLGKTSGYYGFGAIKDGAS